MWVAKETRDNYRNEFKEMYFNQACYLVLTHQGLQREKSHNLKIESKMRRRREEKADCFVFDHNFYIVNIIFLVAR